MKQRIIFFKQPACWLILIIILITSCRAEGIPEEVTPLTMTPPPTQTPLPPTATPIPTKTKEPTITPTATPMATVTPIPTPSDVVWATNVNIETQFETDAQYNLRHILWSPTVNEFLFSDCNNSGLFKASSPNFRIEDITPLPFECMNGFDGAWSPTGEYIVAVVPDEHTPPFTLIAVLSRNGREISRKDYIGGSTWGATFRDWINAETVSVSAYVGGQQSELFLMNIISGEILKRFDGGMGEVNEFDYIRGVKCYYRDMCSALADDIILDRTVDNKISASSFSSLSSGQITVENPISYSQDWVPDENIMLITTWSSTITDTYFSEWQLQLWDIEYDTLTPIVPGGVGGSFTPDGSVLGVWNYSSIQYNEEGIPISADESIHYVHLLDTPNYETIISVPVVSKRSFSYQSGFEQPFSNFARYSPDGKVITIWTTGALDTDADGKVIDTDITDWGQSEDEIYTYLLETQTGKVIHSTRGYHTEPAWSHASDKAIFQNEQGNWVIYTVADGTVVPLTEDGGMYLQSPQWSFDDTYISFEIKKGWGDLQTAVLTAP